MPVDSKARGAEARPREGLSGEWRVDSARPHFKLSAGQRDACLDSLTGGTTQIFGDAILWKTVANVSSDVLLVSEKQHCRVQVRKYDADVDLPLIGSIDFSFH